LAVQLRKEGVISMVHQIVEQLRHVLAQKGQSLELALPKTDLHARCDRERIFQVFSNLVENASKFSPVGATVTIAAKTRPGEILFTVADQGTGISPEHLPHIFEPYWQASQQRRRGLGLGLAIVKGIIDAHASRIWVESCPGAGSQFCFTLPAA
jgi:signal transduction histidine kinase